MRQTNQLDLEVKVVPATGRRSGHQHAGRPSVGIPECAAARMPNDPRPAARWGSFPLGGTGKGHEEAPSSPLPPGAPMSRTGQRIVILGAGFAGLYAALELERTVARDPGVEVLLIDPQNFLLFTPMLHEVASGSLDPELDRRADTRDLAPGGVPPGAHHGGGLRGPDRDRGLWRSIAARARSPSITC